MAIDFKALGAKAAAEGQDMTKSVAGGGDYSPPAAGPTRLRFVSYIELGKQKFKSMGKDVVKDKVLLVFELSGPKHPPTVGADGTKTPIRITVEEALSLNEKANFFKLFTRMNYAGKAVHMAQLLGESYLGTVYHDKWTGKDGKERVDAKLRDDTGYSIRPPRFEDPETGELRVVQVDPPLSEQRCFLWNYADKAQWDSLFIDGSWPERKNDKGEITSPAKSKNVLQERILRAENFHGSPVELVILASGGSTSVDIPDSESGYDAEPEHVAPTAPSRPAAKAEVDPLAGIVA